MAQPFLIVDATGYLFRAFHALGDMRAKDGRPVGAIVGTLTMLERLQKTYPTERMACVMDAGGDTFRHKMDAQYKANRPPLHPDLGAQIAPLHAFIRAWGMPLIQAPGVEADDVIATLARRAAAAGYSVIVASTDKDLMQLVANGQTKLYDSFRDKEFDEKAVAEKFGVAPRQIADYLALVGDSSDNIRGVAKVGAKTAAKWLQAHGSLDAIVAAAGDIGGVVGGNLRAAISDGVLDLARRLVALDFDVDGLPKLDEIVKRDADRAEWARLCDEFQFNRVRKLVIGDEGDGAAAESAESASAPVEMIDDTAALVAWINKIRAAGQVAVDTETDATSRSGNGMTNRLVGVSLAVGGESAYIPLRHIGDMATPSQLSAERALPILKLVLEDEGIGKILHNGKYDWHIFANEGIALRGVLDDTEIIAYDSALPDTSLDALAKSQLRLDTIKFGDLVDGKAVKNFAAVALRAAADYAGECALVTQRLFGALGGQMNDDTRRHYEKRDRPLMPLLARMERAGVRIDSAALEAFAARMREDMARLTETAEAQAGQAFNLNSPKQLAEILFDKLGAVSSRRTGGGARSTSESALEKLAADYPLARTVLEHRMLAKLVGTYAEKLPQAVAASSGRVHTTFYQTAVLTGRLSSASPNLQNIPIKTEAGRRIRRAFIGEDGFCLVSADYSQIELRVMAHMAGDEALCAAFAAGADVHKRTAAEVFGVAREAVTDEQRRAAKAINFGLIYGMSSYGLARALATTPQRAQVYIDRYFARYPKVAAFMQAMRDAAKQQDFVPTAFGRRILLPATGNRFQDRGRVAINAPIQGSAADIVKSAMLAVDDFLRAGNMRSRLILQVHDELIIEAANDEVDELCGRLPGLMEVGELRVPLEVNIGRGANWDEAH